MMDSFHIPSIFYSSGNKKPIEHCAICGKMLLTANEPYIIEKAFKRNSVSKESELIFEYAMCNTCQQKTNNELSKESLANIKMYFDLYVDFEKRQKEFGNPSSFKSSDCLKNCIITNKLIEECNEYQIGGFFYRNQILLDYLPFAIGGKAIDELQEVISKKTRDYLDGFKDRILPVDIRDKVPDDFLILI